jgi:hypothetical protein
MKLMLISIRHSLRGYTFHLKWLTAVNGLFIFEEIPQGWEPSFLTTEYLFMIRSGKTENRGCFSRESGRQ